MTDKQLSVAAEAEASKMAAEVMAAVSVARKFPRDKAAIEGMITRIFSEPSMATAGLFVFKRGNTLISDLTIRAAESIMLVWTNMQSGIVELERKPEASVMLAYARDLETNVYFEQKFEVPHIRHTKAGGAVALTDPRDIYEHCTNMASRRLRKCILALIPIDIKELTRAVIDTTTAQDHAVTEEQIGNLLSAFAEFGVTKAMIVERIGHSLESIVNAEVVSLKRVYASLRDKMGVVQDFFSSSSLEQEKPSVPGDQSVKSRMKKAVKKEEEKEKEEEETQPEEPAEETFVPDDPGDIDAGPFPEEE